MKTAHKCIIYSTLIYAIAVIGISVANIHYSSQPNNIDTHASFIPSSPNNTVCNIYNIHYINYNLAIGQIVLGIIIILMYMCIKSEIAKKQELNQELTDDEFYSMFYVGYSKFQEILCIWAKDKFNLPGVEIVEYPGTSRNSLEIPL